MSFKVLPPPTNPPLPTPECSIYHPERDKTSGPIINPKRKLKNGFTLIELSIVLVIIGLIIGGILTGLDLVNSATIRAQISQIEKYNTAVNTFYGKFAGLPGDIPDPQASNFGFYYSAARTNSSSGIFGDGIIEGYSCLYCQGPGEPGMFWRDLSTAGLIDQSFNTASPTSVQFQTSTYTQYLPSAKIGQNNYIYAYSISGINYFGISTLGSWCCVNTIVALAGQTVQQASNIDRKIDDGLPQSGTVIAKMEGDTNGGQGVCWAWGGVQASGCGEPPGNVANPSNLSCYDNGGNASATMKYSTEENGGGGMNCALSFQIQGAGNR